MASPDILRAAKARIADADRWVQGSFAVDFRGVPVASTDINAVCWCAYGALKAECAASEQDYREHEYLLQRASQDLFCKMPAVVNDVRGHKAVLRVYDRAIELAEQAQ